MSTRSTRRARCSSARVRLSLEFTDTPNPPHGPRPRAATTKDHLADPQAASSTMPPVAKSNAAARSAWRCAARQAATLVPAAGKWDGPMVGAGLAWRARGTAWTKRRELPNVYEFLKNRMRVPVAPNRHSESAPYLRASGGRMHGGQRAGTPGERAPSVARRDARRELVLVDAQTPFGPPHSSRSSS
jgi:hypothetical protein